jgi:hypothetical protein
MFIRVLVVVVVGNKVEILSAQTAETAETALLLRSPAAQSHAPAVAAVVLGLLMLEELQERVVLAVAVMEPVTVQLRVQLAR